MGMENFAGIPTKRYAELEHITAKPVEREIAILNRAEEIIRQEKPDQEQQNTTF